MRKRSSTWRHSRFLVAQRFLSAEDLSTVYNERVAPVAFISGRNIYVCFIWLEI